MHVIVMDSEFFSIFFLSFYSNFGKPENLLKVQIQARTLSALISLYMSFI